MRPSRIGLLVALTLGPAACGSSGNSNVPSGPAAAASDLLGTWSGVDNTKTTNGGGDKPDLFFSWTGNQQNGDAVTGVVVMNAGDSAAPHAGNGGPMTVTVSGSTVTVSMSIPAGGFSFMGSLPNCSMTASGTGTASATQMLFSVTTTFDPSCANGQLYAPPGTVFTGTLSLNKH